MKPIKFQELSFNGSNAPWLVLMVTGIVFIMLNLFEVFSFMDPTVLKFLNAGSYLLAFSVHVRPFLYRNYVEWNKRGIVIRVNSFFGVNFSFADVKSIDYSDDAYRIYTHKGGSPKTIQLAGIEAGSRNRLKEVLQQYVR
ncbi:hypothetical protein FUA23_06340 [Neolewinella aurantiaca]|uniref:Uncharacterized protein n=1 Tax=Neolewinella aurantiaca TaxID=2602767 RepID=A0A5C7FKD4_9BACT|nr:hypothetical protein [Neolewinella aurantiaca]TXF90406.1 hypothetical protein FUA23_06340 [Neolewinella aurantiaca]